MTDFQSRSTVTARKDHRCEHCGKPISLGEPHFKSSGVFEGEFFSLREHTDCSEAWEAMRDLAGLSYDEPSDFLRYHEWDEDSRGWLIEAYPTVAARLWEASHGSA